MQLLWAKETFEKKLNGSKNGVLNGVESTMVAESIVKIAKHIY